MEEQRRKDGFGLWPHKFLTRRYFQGYGTIDGVEYRCQLFYSPAPEDIKDPDIPVGQFIIGLPIEGSYEMSPTEVIALKRPDERGIEFGKLGMAATKEYYFDLYHNKYKDNEKKPTLNIVVRKRNNG